MPLHPQAYLHSMNIIHRDLNSHNCLVREVSSQGCRRASGTPTHHTPSGWEGGSAGTVTIAGNGPHQAAPAAVGPEEGLDMEAGAIRGGLLLFNERDLGRGDILQWEVVGAGSPGSKGQ